MIGSFFLVLISLCDEEITFLLRLMIEMAVRGVAVHGEIGTMLHLPCACWTAIEKGTKTLGFFFFLDLHLISTNIKAATQFQVFIFPCGWKEVTFVDSLDALGFNIDRNSYCLDGLNILLVCVLYWLGRQIHVSFILVQDLHWAWVYQYVFSVNCVSLGWNRDLTLVPGVLQTLVHYAPIVA